MTGTFDLEPVCGRPKGMKINLNDPSHPLIVVDSYRGLLQVDTKTGDIKVLLHSATGNMQTDENISCQKNIWKYPTIHGVYISFLTTKVGDIGLVLLHSTIQVVCN